MYLRSTKCLSVKTFCIKVDGQIFWVMLTEFCIFFNRCTIHSDIHTVHSPTDANLLKL